MQTDADLLREWGQGSRDAGDQLIRRHFDTVFRFFRDKLNADAEDLVQSTFAACVQQRDRFRGDGTFRAFLLGIARFELFNAYRELHKLAAFDPASATLADLTSRISSKLARRDDQRVLAVALRQIPIDDQLLLELRYWEGLNATELAQVFDTTAAAIRGRLHRARELVRQRADALGVDDLAQASAADLEAWVASLRERPPAESG